MPTGAKDIEVIHRSGALEVRPFPNELALKHASNCTLVQECHEVRQTAKILQWGLSEDVRVGAVLDEISVVKQELDKTAHSDKHEARFLKLSFGLELSGRKTTGVVAPRSTIG